MEGRGRGLVRHCTVEPYSSLVHPSRFCATVSAKDFAVHSCMLSGHRFLCLSLLFHSALKDVFGEASV